MTWQSSVAIVALLLAIWSLVLTIRTRRFVRSKLRPRPKVEGQAAVEHGLIAIIVNPIKEEAAEIRAIVEEIADDAGLGKRLWLETTEDDPGAGQAKEALAAGATTVIAAGGDGTVRQVAQVLAGTDVALGIIPLGTGNLLARNLDLPLDSLRAMVMTALTGAAAPIDIGFLSAAELTAAEQHAVAEQIDIPPASVPSGEHAFAVIAGLGFDANMVGDADSALKSKVGWMAYVASAMKNMWGQRIKATVHAGGGEGLELEARSIMFANCGRLPGGVVLAPEADPKTGWLELVVLDTTGGIVGWADLLRRMSLAGVGVTKDALPEAGKIDLRRIRKVKVCCEQPQRIQVDGDVLGYASEVTARVEPGGLLVRR